MRDFGRVTSYYPVSFHDTLGYNLAYYQVFTCNRQFLIDYLTPTNDIEKLDIITMLSLEIDIGKPYHLAILAISVALPVLS